MAEDTGRSSEESDLDLLDDEEEDALFKARMKVANLALGYWKHALGLAGSVLVGAFVVGSWNNHVTDQQRAIHAEISKVERRVQKIQATDGAVDPLGGLTAAAKAAIAGEADKLKTVAGQSEGVGAGYAWVTAAALFEDSDKAADAAACWASAHALGMDGPLGWAAANGHSAALAKAGNVDEAVAIVQPFADLESGGVLAEEAQLAVARMYLDAGRNADGVAALEMFLAKFPESPMVTQVTSELESARVAG